MKRTIITGILIAAFLFNACERRLTYESFEEDKLFSLEELYELPTFRYMDRAMENPEQVFKVAFVKRNYKKVPDEIYRFKYLNILELTLNEINYLPRYVGDMIYLQDLYMASNDFKDIPEHVYDLPHLKRISFADNEITEIPEKLIAKEGIEEIYLGRNDIREIPAELFDMKDLKVLQLDRCLITYLSPDIARLQTLNVLNLGWNGLRDLPYEELKSMKNLRSINLSKNPLDRARVMELRNAMPWARIDF
jgi:Leucine-rich repeat (LRR) protein